MASMKALIIEGPRQAVIRDVPIPIPKADEILVKVHYSGICGTDLAIYSGEISFVKDGRIRYPVRIGHEWSGVVAQVGSQVTDFAVGDPVISDNGISCGVCPACREGRYDDCPNSRSVGTINCWDGSFAEYMLVPARHIYKLPADMDLENAALIEPFSIAYGGIFQDSLPIPDSVAIIGTGAIGLSAVALAKSQDIPRIILVGRTESKLQVGMRLGATHCINSRTEDPVAALLKITGGSGVARVLETSGNIDSIPLGFDLLRQRGVLCLIGFYEQTLNNLPIDQYVAKGLHMVGVMGSIAAISNSHRLVSGRRIDLTPMITQRVPFAECLQVFQTAEQDRHRIKVMVHFPV